MEVPGVVARPASPFRPTARPPVPVLTVCDDGRPDGESIRIREPRFVIGRTEGNLRIPIDGRISARHVEISCQTVAGLSRWIVADLDSTHGLFVRVSRTALADKAEILVGGGLYRFDSSSVPFDRDPATEAYPKGQIGEATVGWDDARSPFRPPALTERIGNEIGNRILLVKLEYWIGSDPACFICRPDDPFCEPRHVRIDRDSKGVWHASNNKTSNGLWLRMSQIVVDSTVQFQIGEQRFRLKVGP